MESISSELIGLHGRGPRGRRGYTPYVLSANDLDCLFFFAFNTFVLIIVFVIFSDRYICIYT